MTQGVDQSTALQRWSARIIALVGRDGPMCWLCDERVLFDVDHDSPWRPSVDHVIERRNGGTNAKTNLRLAHAHCNALRLKLFPEKSGPPPGIVRLLPESGRLNIFRPLAVPPEPSRHSAENHVAGDLEAAPKLPVIRRPMTAIDIMREQKIAFKSAQRTRRKKRKRRAKAVTTENAARAYCSASLYAVKPHGLPTGVGRLADVIDGSAIEYLARSSE